MRLERLNAATGDFVAHQEGEKLLHRAHDLGDGSRLTGIRRMRKLVDVVADAGQLDHERGRKRLALLNDDATIANKIGGEVAGRFARRGRALIDGRALGRRHPNGERRR